MDLAAYLAHEPDSFSDVAKYLLMNTFADEQLSHIYVSELIVTGEVCTIGGFGWTSAEYDSIVTSPIQGKYPVNDAIRNREVVVTKFKGDFPTSYPLLKAPLFPLCETWVTEIAIPAYPIGGIAIFSPLDIELNEGLEVFLIAVGSLIGLYASRLPTALVEIALKIAKNPELPVEKLSGRQLVIAGLLERGFNNAEIGVEIGYSESLVRQETVAIYRILKVSGRKAMETIHKLHLSELDGESLKFIKPL
jgi:DNA-binding CsgD family transcriptional regulator